MKVARTGSRRNILDAVCSNNGACTDNDVVSVLRDLKTLKP